MSVQDLLNYLAIQDPASSFTKSVTEDIDGTVLERLEFIANRVGAAQANPQYYIPSVLNEATNFGQAAVSDGTAWPTANLGIYIPVYLSAAKTLAQIWYTTGGTATGNVDAALYDSSFTRLATVGSTAIGATNSAINLNIADTAMSANTLYYIGFAHSTNTSTIGLVSMARAAFFHLLGCRQEASALPLPATGTPATFAQTKVPFLMLEFTG